MLDGEHFDITILVYSIHPQIGWWARQMVLPNYIAANKEILSINHFGIQILANCWIGTPTSQNGLSDT